MVDVRGDVSRFPCILHVLTVRTMQNQKILIIFLQLGKTRALSIDVLYTLRVRGKQKVSGFFCR